MRVKTTFNRKIQIALGLLWLLDGLLQLQHQMFSKAFITNVITPATIGQPSFVSGPMNFASHIFLLHPAIFNSIVAVIQIGIGLLILIKRTSFWGLIISIPWGLIVWSVGEAYGGIFSGHTLLLMGAPGAALIYVLLAIALLPSLRTKDSQDKPKIAYWLVFAWMVIWVGGGIYQLLPGQNTISDLSSMVSANAQGAPNWLSRADQDMSSAINRLNPPATTSAPVENNKPSAMTMSMGMGMSSTDTNLPNTGYGWVLLLSGLMVIIGLGALKKGYSRTIAISLGIVLSLAFWIYGQSLGGYYSGTATDPNSGPLLILLGLATFGVTNLDSKLSMVGKRIEAFLVGSSLGTKPAVEPS